MNYSTLKTQRTSDTKTMRTKLIVVNLDQDYWYNDNTQTFDTSYNCPATILIRSHDQLYLMRF